MRLALFALLAGCAFGQTLAFSPQIAGKSLELWAVSGCPVRSMAIAEIYRIADQHGITWITPAMAAQVLRRKTVKGRLLEYAGYLGIAASFALTLDWIKANASWQKGTAAFGGILGVLLPALQRNAPSVDPLAGQPLNVGPDGCGLTLFYSGPSLRAGFVEVLK